MCTNVYFIVYKIVLMIGITYTITLSGTYYFYTYFQMKELA